MSPQGTPPAGPKGAVLPPWSLAAAPTLPWRLWPRVPAPRHRQGGPAPPPRHPGNAGSLRASFTGGLSDFPRHQWLCWVAAHQAWLLPLQGPLTPIYSAHRSARHAEGAPPHAPWLDVQAGTRGPPGSEGRRAHLSPGGSGMMLPSVCVHVCPGRVWPTAALQVKFYRHPAAPLRLLLLLLCRALAECL